MEIQEKLIGRVFEITSNKSNSVFMYAFLNLENILFPENYKNIRMSLGTVSKNGYCIFPFLVIICFLRLICFLLQCIYQ